MILRAIKKVILLIFVVGLTSCASREEIAYFQDEKIGSFTPVDQTYQLYYQPDDMITIDISALDPEAVRPFLLMSPSSTSQTQTDNQTGSSRAQTYIIDNQGNIDFPVLGTIKLANLSRNEATKLLQTEISKYVKDPIVNIRLINFTVTILGEVNNPGTFTITDEKATLTEVLGMAGDLTIHGRRDNILLIRTEEGLRKYSKINLTTVKTLYGPSYNLKQDDLIIIEPNKAKIRTSRVNENNDIIISAVATLATIAAILIR